MALLEDPKCPVRDIYLEGTEMRYEVWKSFFGKLKLNVRITSLRLQDVVVGRDVIIMLGDVLIANKTLTKLSLIRSIGIAGLQCLCDSLGKNASIRSLELYQNDLGNELARPIGRLLKDNHNITSMDLRETLIEDEGVISLVSSLKECQGLRTLDVGNNPITDIGAENLLSLLQEHPTLIDIGLMGTLVSVDVHLQILKDCQIMQRSSLEKIDFELSEVINKLKEKEELASEQAQMINQTIEDMDNKM